MACCNLQNVAWGHAWEACSHLKLPGTDSLPLSGMLPTPQLFNTLHTFRHPCIVLNLCQWGCTETAKSFIYQLCMAWCPTSKTDLTLECQTLQSASWRNSNGNRFVCWAFCAPWTWKQTECFPLTFLGQHIMLLAKLAPISSYPALIRCRSVACFRRPNFSIHYIPSGIPALCWTHANGV